MKPVGVAVIACCAAHVGAIALVAGTVYPGIIGIAAVLAAGSVVWRRCRREASVPSVPPTGSLSRPVA